MKFTMIPTWTGAETYVDRGDELQFLGLPMPGERVADVDLVAVDGSTFPAVVPMTQLIEWWHRVRKWSATATHPFWGTESATLELDESDTTDEEITADNTLAWFKAGRWTGQFTWVYEPAPDGDEVFAFDLQILAEPEGVFNLPSYYLDGDFTRILPFIRLKMDINGVDGINGSGDSAGFYDEDPPPTPDGTITATLDGIPLTIAAALYDTLLEDDEITVTLTPSLWWEYRDADGTNPKYNALTGAKL